MQRDRGDEPDNRIFARYAVWRGLLRRAGENVGDELVADRDGVVLVPRVANALAAFKLQYQRLGQTKGRQQPLQPLERALLLQDFENRLVVGVIGLHVSDTNALGTSCRRCAQRGG